MPRSSPLVAALITTFALYPALAKAEQVMAVQSRGQTVKVLVERPSGSKGVLVLLPGGDGDLQLTDGGGMGGLKGNQLVRSRALFSAAGYTTVLPDVAPDLHEGSGVRPGYRWSPAHALDIGAVIAALRQPGQQVVLVGTSRGALSVANAVARLQGPSRPDKVVITSGMLMNDVERQPSVQRNVPGMQAATQPFLFVVHAHDTCPLSAPDSAQRYRPLLRAAAAVQIVTLDGGLPGRGDPCEANSAHGFLGLDQKVADTITRWAGQ